MDQIRQKAKLFLNGVIRAKVKEYEALCQKYPEFSKERELPEGGWTKGGLLQDLEVWRFALQPNPYDAKKRTLIDELMPDPEVLDMNTIGNGTGTSSNIMMTEVQWGLQPATTPKGETPLDSQPINSKASGQDAVPTKGERE